MVFLFFFMFFARASLNPRVIPKHEAHSLAAQGEAPLVCVVLTQCRKHRGSPGETCSFPQRSSCAGNSVHWGRDLGEEKVRMYEDVNCGDVQTGPFDLRLCGFGGKDPRT